MFNALGLSDNQKVGLAMTGLGLGFLLLGMLLLFDSGLLAIGNILFLVGLALLVGIAKFLEFFNPMRKKGKPRGVACFVLGVLLVLWRWSVIGMLLELFGAHCVGSVRTRACATRRARRGGGMPYDERRAARDGTHAARRRGAVRRATGRAPSPSRTRKVHKTNLSACHNSPLLCPRPLPAPAPAHMHASRGRPFRDVRHLPADRFHDARDAARRGALPAPAAGGARRRLYCGSQTARAAARLSAKEGGDIEPVAQKLLSAAC